MARPPDLDEPRIVTIPVRFTPTGAALVDAARGDLSRSAYIRALISTDAYSRDITPKDAP